MKSKISYIYISIISIIFLCLVSLLAILFTISLNQSQTSPQKEPEIIYVYAEESKPMAEKNSVMLEINNKIL